MRIFFLILLVSIPGQTLFADETGILNEVKRATGQSISSFKSLSSAPPEEAWRGYRSIRGSFKNKEPDTVRLAAIQIAKNVAVGDFIAGKLEELPYSTTTDAERMDYFTVLGSIPSPWSAKLLGKYLMSDKVMDTSYIPNDHSVGSNAEYTALGLSMMKFSDAPTTGNIGELSPDNVQRWKAWWKNNELRIDQRIREINSSYKPQTVAISTPASKILVQPVAAQFSSTPAATLPPTDFFSFEKSLAVAFLLAVVAGGLVFFLRRKL